MPLRRTLSQFIGKVRQNVDETGGGGFWTDANITAALNRAKDRCWTEVRKAAQDFFAITRSSTDGALTILGESYPASSFAIAPGVRDYVLPPDCAEIRAIECITSGQEHVRFRRQTLSDTRFRTALVDQTPQSPGGFLYAILGERTMRIAPLSDTALDVRLTYIAILPDLVAPSDPLEMPYALHGAVEEYATADCLMMDRAPESAAWEARGNSSIARFLGANERATTDPEYVSGYLEDF